MKKQTTLGSEATISGKGLHTGKNVTVTFKPAGEDHGIVFQRIDLENKPLIPADVKHVFETDRGTSIKQGDVEIRTIEHLMAALAGLCIDNILIEVDGVETPILDGSSKQYIEKFLAAGLLEQEKEREYITVHETIKYENPEIGVELILFPAEDFKVSVMVDYGTEVLATQHASLGDIEDFHSEISASRTFVFLHELQYLIDNNLVKGGDIDNAIVFVDKKPAESVMEHLSGFFNKTDIQVMENGTLNNVQLQYLNEPARHKLLDLLGDLYLLGKPLKGHIIAKKPGHLANIEFAKLIASHIKAESDIFHCDLTRTLYDINDIRRLLPHRPPFLLIDRIIEMDETSVVGIKNVTMNEPFFVGHFPEEPVMPGVLIVEALAQTGGILVLSQVDEPERYSTYFLKIDAVKFRNKVIPGDTLVLRMNFLSPFRRGICHMQARAYVNGKVVVEAELMAQVVKNR